MLSMLTKRILMQSNICKAFLQIEAKKKKKKKKKHLASNLVWFNQNFPLWKKKKKW